MDRLYGERALGFAIRERRQRLGLSQEQVALDSGLQRKTVYQLENGLVSPQFGTLLSVLGDLRTLVEVLRRANELVSDG
ncbi:MAG: helix-turn-helix protein [Solirubrobacteraceae bacterium]|jgi:transcriptional regulator with XRE-family HTH domain|nr:helix-turn-helix protein [Solirubrobacteraceae bacterium]